MMQARTRYARMVALGGAAALAAVTFTPTSAVAATSDKRADKKFEVAKDGKIIARGAAVKIKFSYSCPKGWQGNASVNLVEALSDSFATGYGGKTIKCTGAQEEETYFVQANAYEGSRPFQPGDASIVASLDAWNPEDQGCGDGPCPMPVDDAPAAAPGGKSSVTPSASESKVKMPSSLHREFNGVIDLK